MTKEKGKFIPTELGMFVTDLLVVTSPPDGGQVHGPDGGSARQISEGGEDWRRLPQYSDLLNQDLAKAGKAKSVQGPGIPVDEKCPKCGKPLVIRSGGSAGLRPAPAIPSAPSRRAWRRGHAARGKVPHLRLPARPAARPLRPLRGLLQLSDLQVYQEGETTETGIACPPGCGGTLLKRTTRRGKIFYGCSRFPKCRFATWDEPLVRACPKCGKPFLPQET